MKPSTQQQSVDWERLFNIAPCGMVLLDSQTAITRCNPAAGRLVAVEPEQMVGRRLLEVLPTWKDTSLQASFPSLVNGQSTFDSMDFELPGPEQTKLRVSVAVVPDARHHTEGILLIITECTEVATLERRLHRSERQASIGKLARGIAHELNSPLDGVLRYTYLALEHLKEDSPVREHLMHVKEGLDRMVRAVRAFLEFSRQVTTPVTRAADLNQLIDDVMLLVQHRAKFQRVRIVKQFDSGLPAVVDGGLQHAVANLVKNAFDAMPRGGTLTITTSQRNGGVLLAVEDTGGGITEEVRTRIFEPFFSTKPIHQGSGLGLVIAKDAVERSGGRIEFESTAGVGTTFRIQVPVAGDSVESANGT